MKIIKQFGLLLATLLPVHAHALDLAVTPYDHSLDLSFVTVATLPNNDLLLAEAESANSTATEAAPQSVQSNNHHLLKGLALDIPSTPDSQGLWGDTKLFLLYQVGVIGVIWLMPESISKWDDEDRKGNIFRKWDDNVNNLRRDKDEWSINYFWHPYWGSVYYTRARNRGYDRQQSFWYSVGMSTMFEYGVEALFEPVSVQDLIFTPVGGTIMGEYFMNARTDIRNRILATGKVTTSDKIKLFLTDPLGVINQKVEHMIHDEASFNVFPVMKRNTMTADNGAVQTNTYYGVQAMLNW